MKMRRGLCGEEEIIVGGEEGEVKWHFFEGCIVEICEWSESSLKANEGSCERWHNLV